MGTLNLYEIQGFAYAQSHAAGIPPMEPKHRHALEEEQVERNSNKEG